MSLGEIHWTVKELADMTKLRIKNRYDSNIAVTGNTGLGKSTFLWKFFHKFKDFKVEDKLTYDRKETINLIKNFKYSYCWNDELISSGNKRKFYDVEQIELIEVLTKYRSNYNIVGGAVPVFFTLDKELIKLFGMHINIISRGIGVVHLPRQGRMFSDDPWDVKINSKLEEKWSAKIQKNPDFKIPYHKYTTFAGYIFFGKLTDKQEQHYEKLKASKRGDNQDEEKEINLGFYERVLKLLKEHKLTNDGLFQLCSYGGKKLSSAKIRLNQMLRDEGLETLGQLLKSEEKNTKNTILNNNYSRDKAILDSL